MSNVIPTYLFCYCAEMGELRCLRRIFIHVKDLKENYLKRFKTRQTSLGIESITIN